MLPYLLTLQALSGALRGKPVEPVTMKTEPIHGAFVGHSIDRLPIKKSQFSDLEAVLKVANREVFSVDEVAELLVKNRSLLKTMLTVWIDKNRDGRISDEEFVGKHFTQ
ncbi:uncharacterized protein LOC121387581 [Gigantopelta aegis]|uniref:uncharacterized protein LOC121387581 n=1 Tax=Gigantopelta aegis TaxID=1735272 RepID=UPI001B888778|nr:uncharacterized protein LOC121387581 [Gigantopelta aegis]